MKLISTYLNLSLFLSLASGTFAQGVADIAGADSLDHVVGEQKKSSQKIQPANQKRATELLKFKSLPSLKKEYSNAYGPPLSKVLPFLPKDFAECQIALVYKTEKAINYHYKDTHKIIAGRKIIALGKELKGKQLKKLVDLLVDYRNHGDVMIGSMLPSYAIELVFKNNSFVLNYYHEVACINFSSSTLPKGDLAQFKIWTTPLQASPILVAFLNEIVENQIKK